MACAAVTDLFLRNDCERACEDIPPPVAHSVVDTKSLKPINVLHKPPAGKAGDFESSMRELANKCEQCDPYAPTCCTSASESNCFRSLEPHCNALREATAAIGLNGVLSALDNLSMPSGTEEPVQPDCWDGFHVVGAYGVAHAQHTAGAVISLCRTVRNPILLMACSHGAIYTATSNYLRQEPMPSPLSVWKFVAGQADVTGAVHGDAAMLAHIAHGAGHGVALGVLASSAGWHIHNRALLNRGAADDASSTLPVPHLSPPMHTPWAVCKPPAVIASNAATLEQALAICDAAPHRQLAYLCAGGVYMSFIMLSRRQPRQSWSDPCSSSSFPALCFRSVLPHAPPHFELQLLPPPTRSSPFLLSSL